MMQNGFRRIALAQGLLPDRLPPREAAPPEPTSGANQDAPGADRAPPAWSDRDADTRIAGAA
jgi:hypothetical protein